MGVSISSIFRQVQNSTSNDFLLANCSKLITETIRLGFDFDFTSNVNDLVMWNDNSSLKLLNGNWGDKGFVIGDEINLSGEITDSQSGGVLTFNPTSIYTVDNIIGDTMYISPDAAPSTFLLGGVMMPQQGVSTPLEIKNTSRTQPEEIEFYHNLILNNTNHSQGSVLDGEVNRFVIEDADTVPTFPTTAPIIQKGNRSGGRYIIDECSISYSGIVSGEAVYQLVLRYFLLPYEFADFDRPEWFVGNQCLKATIEVLGYPETNNPNSELSAISFAQQGNNGWHNENYNQGDNDFVVKSFDITTGSGDPLSEVDHNQLNKLSAEITGPDNFLDVVEIVFEIIPPTADFKNNQFSNLENSYVSYWNINNPFPGSPTIEKFVFEKNSGSVDNLNQSIDVATANTINIDWDVDPNGAFASYINSLNEPDRRYRITAVVESVGGTNNDNNSVSLILKEGILTEAPIPDQPFDGVKEQGFFNHIQDIDTGVSELNYNGRTEDDMVFKSIFDLEDNDEWERINLSVEVVKLSDGTSFDLFSRTFNITGNPNAPMVNGVIQLDFEEQLPQFLDAPERNKISIKNTGNTGSGTYEVELIWSMMANWRYWIQNSTAFQAFYDNTLSNSGKNQEWVRYLELSGYALRARVRLIKDDVAYYFGGNINLLDYDDWNGTTTHTFFDTQGNVVTAIIQGQDLRMRADHVLNSGSWDINDMWGYIAFRPQEADPRKQISTFWDWTAQNLPLKPKAGETKATLEIITTNNTDDTARVECLIDGSLITDLDNTPVSRIQSPKQPACQHPIDYVFDYIEANIVNDSDILLTYNTLLNNSDASDKNICCPTCEFLYNGGFVFGETTVFAIGSKIDIDALISTGTTTNPEGLPNVCCSNTYKDGTPYDACNVNFDADVDSIRDIVDGDWTTLMENNVSILNSYTGANEVLKIKERLEQLTSDEVIRFDLLSEIIERGLVMRCKIDPDSGETIKRLVRA